MFPCRVSWKNYLIFLGKVCIFFEHSILPIIHILLNGAFFVQNKCCAVGGILWNFHVVFRWLSQLHNHGIEHNNANTSRFCGHTKSYLARRFSEIIWKHLKLSDDFRRILKTSEFIWIHLKIFWILMIFWKQMKLSEIIWWFPALSEIATSKTWAECVFFRRKKTTRRNVIARGFGGLAPPSAVTKFNFCCFKKQQNWLWKQQILGSQTEKVRLTYLSTEVDVFVNWGWRIRQLFLS